MIFCSLGVGLFPIDVLGFHRTVFQFHLHRRGIHFPSVAMKMDHMVFQACSGLLEQGLLVYDTSQLTFLLDIDNMSH